MSDSKHIHQQVFLVNHLKFWGFLQDIPEYINFYRQEMTDLLTL